MVWAYLIHVAFLVTGQKLIELLGIINHSFEKYLVCRCHSHIIFFTKLNTEYLSLFPYE